MASFECQAQKFGLFGILNQSYGMVKGGKVRVAKHCVNSRKMPKEDTRGG